VTNVAVDETFFNTLHVVFANFFHFKIFVKQTLNETGKSQLKKYFH